MRTAHVTGIDVVKMLAKF